MANVSANINTTSISVTNTPSNITVTDLDSGSNVNVTISNTNLTVGTTQTNVLVSAGSILSNAVIRNAFTVNDAGGDGSLSYVSSTGVFTYTGPSQAEVLAHFSNVSPINLEANGQISVDESAIFSGKTTDDLTEGSTNLYFKQSANNTTSGTITAGAFVGDGSGLTGGVSFLTNAQVITHISTIPLTVGGNLTVNGNLEVSGNLNYRNVEDLYVRDQKITLNANALSNSNVEIISNRPTATDAIIRWNEQDDKWQFTNDGTTYIDLGGATEVVVDNGNISGNVSLNVDSGTIHKGLLVGNITGLNFTNIASGQTITTILTQDSVGTRLLDTTTTPSNWTAWEFVGDNKTLSTNPDAIDILVTVYDGSKYYASLVSIDGRLIENASLANSNITVNGTTIDLGSSGNIANFGTLTTDDLSEGSTNQYYTDARSRAAVSVTQASASGNGTLSYSNTTGVFTYTPPDISTFGLTNAQAQAFIEADGLDMTGNMTFTGATITTDALITTTGNIVSGSLTIDSTDSGTLKYVRDSELVVVEAYSYGTQANTNVYRHFASGGTAASPAILGNDDRVHAIEFTAHDGVQLSPSPQAGMHVFYDRDTDTIGANNVPLAFEWWVNPDAANADVSLNFEQSVFKITPDRRVVFNNTGTRRFGNNRGLASIEADGNIHTQQGVSANNTISTTAGSISGPTLTDTVLSINSGSITSAVGGTFSGTVQAGTFTDGTLSITGGNISTAQNIGATGTIDTNGLIKTFGGNVEAPAGNIVGAYLHGDGSNISGLPSGVTNAQAQAYIQENGLTMTSAITSNSNIETTSFFVGDIDGAVVQDVRNETGATLSKGKAVYLTGSATGDNPHVALADADDSAKMPALGIVYSDIANASVGQVATSGVINVASHGFTQGADLFISATAGDLSETAPTGETGLIQKIGKVVGPNHILVQGAFRTNATPNLNDGNFFLGNASNKAVTAVFTDEANTAIAANLAALTSNIITTGNVQINPDVYKPGTPQSNQGLLGFTFDTSTNRLGLGTASPEAAIEIVANDDNDAQIYLTEYHDNASGTDIRFRKARNYIEAPEVLVTGDSIMQLFTTPWLLDTPDNTTSGSFSFSPLEINAFADGAHGGSDSVVVTSYSSNGADGDEILLANRSASYSDGNGVKFSGATNANLTPLNGNVFYVDRSGGSTSRRYDLYYDQELTNPVQLTGDLTDVTGLTAEFKSVYQPVGLETTQFLSNGDGSVTSSFHKLRANGTIQIGCSATDDGGTPEMSITNAGVVDTAGNLSTTANVNAAGGTLTGAVTSNSNITTTANVSGGYILGNGSQLTGVAASYGNAEVTAFLDSDTMTGNIEYTGNLLVGAPAANVNVTVQAYFGNVNTGSQDQFQPTSNLDVVDGAAVLFHSQAGGTPLTFLNGNVYYVTSVGGGVWNLFEDAGLTTQLKSGLDNESGNINGLTVEYVGQGTSKANIEGSVFVTNSVEAEDDVKAGNALFGDRIYPFTGGGTIGFTGARMSDVGLGGGGGNDFFWPETGRPDAGSLLIAGTGGQGYWSQGVVLENETLTSPVLANISSSTTNYQGSETIYRRSRGNISAPTAVQENSGSNPDVITSVKYFGHDGTSYQPSFFSNVFVDGPVSANNMPMALEISTWENGDLTKTNSGFGFPILKLRSNRSLEFNSPNPLNYNNPQGNANITADGSFNTNASIVAVGDITGTTVNATNISVTGTSISTANNTVFTIGTDPDHKLEIQAEHARLKFEADVDSPHLQVYTYRNGTVGGTREYYRSSGSAASPTAIGNNDIVLNEEYFGHDGTSFGTPGRPNANFQVFQDDTVGTSTGVVPLSMEWTVNSTGHGGSTFGQSCIKIASDRTLHLQDVNTRGFTGAYDGNVKIVEDGSITTKANVTVGDRLQLKSYSNTEILALTSLTAGEVVYNSTDNLVAYYDGTNWRNIAQGAIVT